MTMPVMPQIPAGMPPQIPSWQSEIRRLQAKVDELSRKGAPPATRCVVQFSGTASIPATDVYAQGGWSAVDDKGGWFSYVGGGYSQITIPVTTFYVISFRANMNPTSGECLAAVTRNARAIGNSIARDNRPAASAGGDNTWVFAYREMTLNAGDVLYWENWSSVASTLYGTYNNTPTEVVVRMQS